MEMLAPLEVGIACADLDRLVPFYTDTLGLTLVEVLEVSGDRAKQTSLTQGSYRVARLQTATGERVKLLQPSIPPRPPAPYFNTLDVRTNSYLTFVVADLVAVMERVRGDTRATLVSGQRPVEVRPGVWLAFVKDPEGNLLEFVQVADIAAYRPDLYGPGAGP